MEVITLHVKVIQNICQNINVCKLVFVGRSASLLHIKEKEAFALTVEKYFNILTILLCCTNH